MSGKTPVALPTLCNTPTLELGVSISEISRSAFQRSRRTPLMDWLSLCAEALPVTCSGGARRSYCGDAWSCEGSRGHPFVPLATLYGTWPPPIRVALAATPSKKSAPLQCGSKRYTLSESSMHTLVVEVEDVWVIIRDNWSTPVVSNDLRNARILAVRC